MNKHFRSRALALVGIVICLSLPAVAQSPTAGARCPEGYWRLESVCVTKATGDVVNATPPATVMTDEHGCAPGYWRLEQVCVSKVTGDVELVEEQQSPKARNECKPPLVTPRDRCRATSPAGVPRAPGHGQSQVDTLPKLFSVQWRFT